MDVRRLDYDACEAREALRRRARVSRQHRTETRGRNDLETIRNRNKAAVTDHIRSAIRGSSTDDLVLQAQAPAKIDTPRLIGDETVGAAFDQETVLVDGFQDSTWPVAGFQQLQRGVRHQLAQVPDDSQSGDTPANIRYT